MRAQQQRQLLRLLPLLDRLLHQLQVRRLVSSRLLVGLLCRRRCSSCGLTAVGLLAAAPVHGSRVEDGNAETYSLRYSRGGQAQVRPSASQAPWGYYALVFEHNGSW